jgi:muramoyltetrapeptide carboxypeptidase
VVSAIPPVNRHQLRLPQAPAVGQAIGIWTPSSPAPALFPRRYRRALDALRATGFEAVTVPSTEGNAGISAASPEQLAADLHRMLRDDRVGAVLGATGGHTSSAVLRHIDWDLVREARKPFIGYSDLTTVLWSVLSRARTVAFHGPMLVSEWGEWGGPWAYTVDNLRRALRPDAAPVQLAPPDEWTDESLWWDAEDDRRRTARPGRWRCLLPGRAEGWLLPGCAATAAHLFGTPYLPPVDGAILCLEFLEMGPDQVWAHLVQWEDSGLLDRVSGLVIGRHFRPRAAAAGSEDFDAVIRAVVGHRKLPVLVDVDFGHTEPRLTLPVGAHALLDADGCGLTLLENSTSPP